MKSGRYLVPSQIITSIANLRHGGANKVISSLLRDNLLSHDQSCGYDGYRITNSGWDILALWNLKSRGYVSALGDQIGVGKESDVYLAVTPSGRQVVIKFHRLGRTSFRDVKKKRDYFVLDSMKGGRRHGRKGIVTTVTSKDRHTSWLFLSKISATKEYSFMKALHSAGYRTPEPVTHNRHAVVMGLIRGVPLYQVRPPPSNSDGTTRSKGVITPDQVRSIMEQAVAIGTQLARNGLVHCDLNEFNLMVDLSGGVQSRGHLDIHTVVGGNVKDDVGDHYVRHSGSSASVISRGRGALTLPHGIPGNNINQTTMMDGTGEIIAEEDQNDEPEEYLENGVDPKPVVTLIDFPQMISVKHPNAEELWHRDMQCLKRFFTMKLKCYVSDEEWDEEYLPKWEELVKNIEKEEELIQIEDDDEQQWDCDDGEETLDGSKSIFSTKSSSSLIPKRQLRLDQELHASGFSKVDAERNMELHYYQPEDGNGPIQEDEKEEEEEEEEEEEIDNREDLNVENVNEYNGEISDNDEFDKDGTITEVHIYREKDNSENNDEDDLSTAAFSTSSRVQSRAQAEEIARQRVRRHLDARKKGKGRKNAFKPRNNNKTFVKGKRVFQDFTL